MAVALIEQVYNQLLKMIIRRELKPGNRPPSEMVLCDQMGTNRNTLWAALNKLDALGFTVSYQGGGTYVKGVNSGIYLNFFAPALLTHNVNPLKVMQFRKSIEVEAARLATANATGEDTTKLNELLEHCKGNLDEMERLTQSNTDFHTTVVGASHNMMSKKVMEVTRMMILTETQNFLMAQGEDIDSTFYYGMVLQCIIEGKPEETAFSMECHLTLVIKCVEKYIKRETKNSQVERVRL